MCDPAIISKLYASVLHEDIKKYHVTNSDIRTGIQNMKEVYKPNSMSLNSDHLDVANYDDPAHRCGYLHKYAPFHTGMVAEMVKRAVLDNPKLFKELISSSGSLSICSLGGGPGSDVIGVMSVLNSTYGFFQVTATIVDCMSNWRQTFASLIQELRYGAYGALGQCVSDQYFSWNYLASNLLGTMSNDVNTAISRANLLTMIKFVSASACKDSPAMIKKIFRAMKPGALVLYIDNAGGGFHQLVKTEAEMCNLITIFCLRHEPYNTNDYNVKRFGYIPCLLTKVSVHIWRKPLSASARVPRDSNRGQPKNNVNRSRSTTPSRTNVNKKNNMVKNYHAVPPPNIENRGALIPNNTLTSIQNINRPGSSTLGQTTGNVNAWDNAVKYYQGRAAQNPANRLSNNSDYMVNRYLQTIPSQNLDNRRPSSTDNAANRNRQGVQYLANNTNVNAVQPNPQRPSPTRSLSQQPRSFHYARPSPGSGYRPAPNDEPAEEAEQCCCCVIS